MRRLLFIVTFAVITFPAKAKDIYVAQTAAGAANGADCADAYAYTFFNSSANWGTGSSQIGPGTTVHLCGTISSELQFQGGGNSSAVVTLHFESGAELSAAVFSPAAIDLGGYSYILVDGGVPCGPGTSCSSGMSGTGIIQNTANGTSLANQLASNGISTGGGTGDTCGQNIEIRNLIIENIYVRTSTSDESAGAGGTSGVAGFPCGSNFLIHDSTMSFAHSGIDMAAANGASNWQFYNNVTRHNTWGIVASIGGSGIVLTNLDIYGNDVDNGSDWNDPDDTFHFDGIFVYGNGSTGYINGANIYNNYLHGNWGQNGSSSAATAQMYINQNLENFNIFNNVFDLSASGAGNSNGAIAIGYGDSNFLIANNTCIGAGGTVTYSSCIGDAGGGDTGIVVENNIEEHIISGVNLSHAATAATVNYNVNYDITGEGENGAWCNTSCYDTFPTWQGAGNDVNGAYVNPSLSSGYVPQNSATEIGTNLYSTCSGQPSPGLGALCLDKAGNKRQTTGGGNWSAGAYSSASGSAPSPATGLTATAH